MGKECFRWRGLSASNAGDGHNYRPSDTSDSGSYGKAMMGMVTATDQAILQIVASTEKQCWVWSFVIAEEEIVQYFFLEKVFSNN